MYINNNAEVGFCSVRTFSGGLENRLESWLMYRIDVQ